MQWLFFIFVNWIADNKYHLFCLQLINTQSCAKYRIFLRDFNCCLLADCVWFFGFLLFCYCFCCCFFTRYLPINGSLYLIGGNISSKAVEINLANTIDDKSSGDANIINTIWIISILLMIFVCGFCYFFKVKYLKNNNNMYNNISNCVCNYHCKSWCPLRDFDHESLVNDKCSIDNDDDTNGNIINDNDHDSTLTEYGTTVLMSRLSAVQDLTSAADTATIATSVTISSAATKFDNYNSNHIYNDIDNISDCDSIDRDDVFNAEYPPSRVPHDQSSMANTYPDVADAVNRDPHIETDTLEPIDVPVLLSSETSQNNQIRFITPKNIMVDKKKPTTFSKLKYCI